MGERNFFSGRTVDFEGLEVLALLWIPPIPGWPVPPSSTPNWQMLYPAQKDAVGFGELNLSRGPGWPPPPSPEQDLLPDAGPQPCLPPWWRVPTCLALRAAACRTATRSTCGSHTSFVCQQPHALCPLEALLPKPAGLSSPPGPSVPGLARPGRQG